MQNRKWYHMLRLPDPFLHFFDVLSPSNILHFESLNKMLSFFTNFQNWSVLANIFKTNNVKHKNGRRKHASIYSYHFVSNQNLRSPFFARTYCEKCRFAPGSDPTELQHSELRPLDRISGICDIIRRSMVFAYRHFEYFLFLIAYFFCFIAMANINELI